MPNANAKKRPSTDIHATMLKRLRVDVADKIEAAYVFRTAFHLRALPGDITLDQIAWEANRAFEDVDQARVCAQVAGDPNGTAIMPALNVAWQAAVMLRNESRDAASDPKNKPKSDIRAELLDWLRTGVAAKFDAAGLSDTASKLRGLPDDLILCQIAHEAYTHQ